jgi:hypothetical protein
MFAQFVDQPKKTQLAKMAPNWPIQGKKKSHSYQGQIRTDEIASLSIHL